MVRTTLALAAAAIGVTTLAAPVVAQQNEQFIPLLVYRTGAYAVNGVPYANGVLDYYHTFVPPEARGRGIASRLVSFALDDARAHGLRVRPSCPFVARFVAAQPRYADLLESSA